MGSHIMSAHIMNKTLLMEFLQSARKKKIIKAADRKFKLEKFILGKKKNVTFTIGKVTCYLGWSLRKGYGKFCIGSSVKTKFGYSLKDSIFITFCFINDSVSLHSCAWNPDVLLG